MIPFVPDIVPDILQALVLTIAFTLAAGGALRKHPLPFYVLFIVASLLTFVDLERTNAVAYTIVNLFASCYTGVAFYLLVMFTGALPVKWSFTKLLYSVRSQLSILAGFIIMAHVAKVSFFVPMSFTGYWPLIWQTAAPIMFAASTIVGLPLLVCFVAPWITSFPQIRSRMEHNDWKKIQRMAYPFMALLVLQGMLLALGHAVYVGHDAANYSSYIATGITYAVIGIAYLVLKTIKAFKQQKAKEDALAAASLKQRTSSMDAASEEPANEAGDAQTAAASPAANANADTDTSTGSAL